MIRILFFLSLSLLSLSAFAAGEGIMLRPAGMYWSHQFNDGATAETKTTVNHMDGSIGLGFAMGNGLYIGGTYYLSQEETKIQSNSGTTEEKDTHTAYGPTLGLVANSFYLLGTYHLAPVYVTGTDSSKTTYSGGMGYQVDIGYMFWLSGSLGVGPQFTYYYADFKKTKGSTGTETDIAKGSAAVTDLRPMVAFAFMF